MIRRYLFLLLSLVTSLSLCIAQEYRQYVVQRGESKSYIASKFGLSEQELSDANPLFPTFYSGLSINVPIIERVKEEDKVQEASPSSTQKNRSNKRSGRSFWQVLGEVFALSVLPTPAPAPMPMPGYIPMPVPPPISIPEYTFQFGDNADVHSWGNGFAGPMQYSTDPILNAAYGITATEQNLMQQGITIKHDKEDIIHEPSKPATLKDAGSYECPCSGSPTFGLDTYHKCSNCGENHRIGSYHMCKIKQ